MWVNGPIFKIIKRSLHSHNLSNHTALVTGGSRGLGLTIAQKLAASGCNIILCSRNEIKLQEAIWTLPIIRNSHHHSTLPCDLSNLNNIEEVFQNNSDSLKSINILINCAGIMQTSLMLRTSSSRTSNFISTNLTAPMILSQKIAKFMLRTSKLPEIRYNSIINISSVLGQNPVIGSTVYCASKAGLEMFTKSFAKELNNTKIKVVAISPGLVIDSKMGQDEKVKSMLQLMGDIKPCTKEEVAEVVIKAIVGEYSSGSVCQISR